MLLAIQIYFAVKAFKNGWRFRVLIPSLIMAAASFAIGFATAAAPMDPLDTLALSLPIDLGFIGVLVYMANHGPAEHAEAHPEIPPAARMIT